MSDKKFLDKLIAKSIFVGQYGGELGIRTEILKGNFQLIDHNKLQKLKAIGSNIKEYFQQIGFIQDSLQPKSIESIDRVDLSKEGCNSIKIFTRSCFLSIHCPEMDKDEIYEHLIALKSIEPNFTYIISGHSIDILPSEASKKHGAVQIINHLNSSINNKQSFWITVGDSDVDHGMPSGILSCGVSADQIFTIDVAGNPASNELKVNNIRFLRRNNFDSFNQSENCIYFADLVNLFDRNWQVS